MSKVRHEIPLKRRRNKETDYSKRLALLKSEKHRLVLRKSNKYVSAQLVKYSRNGDETIVAAFSKELNGFGFKGNKNIPSCYLTGYLLGKRAIAKGVNEAIVDIGIQTPHHKSRLFAIVKGLLDSGMAIPVDVIVLPTEDMYSGKTIENYAKALDKEKLEKRFSEYLKQGLDPKNIVNVFNASKKKIDESKV
ncbi:MAG: 50S ribosomal protein L18 [archaeon]